MAKKATKSKKKSTKTVKKATQKAKKATKAIKNVKKSLNDKDQDVTTTAAKDTPITDNSTYLRVPAEVQYKKELIALKQNDFYPKPPNWELSPKMVEIYILGTKQKIPLTINGKKELITIKPKFYGSQSLVQKAIVTLASERALMLIGEPGTGKSWLSEHLTAAISGKSTYLIQGTAGTTEDQIRYTWNYALLIAEGPSENALVSSPTIKSMQEGKVLRIEELSRCPQEIQDTLISILSEKILPIPELGKDYYIMAKKGFNVIATANDRDRGVNEMSAALKRRFNFLYVPIVQDIKMEQKIVESRVNEIMASLNFKIQIPTKILDMLTTSFYELRNGRSINGRSFKKISSVMSTSEEISLLLDCCLHGNYFGEKKITSKDLAMLFCDTIVKNDKQNIPILYEYLNLVIKPRAKGSTNWRDFSTELTNQISKLR